jgi:glycosyltransferase involved in cell wall biosynthesis
MDSFHPNQIPLVSVAMISYNHQAYITEAVESVLMQQTNFSIELVIGDDNSTDNTRNILEEIQKRHGNIRILPPGPNVGMMKNAKRTIQAYRGKYIAFIEGDDYWTDPLKLQTQIDFLEKNPDYTLSFHNVRILNSKNPLEQQLSNKADTPEEITQADLLSIGNMINTVSAVIRADVLRNHSSWSRQFLFGDYPIFLLLARYGRIRYMDQAMAVYRIHDKGAHGHLTNSPVGLTKAYRQQYQFWQKAGNYGLVEKKMTMAPRIRVIHSVIRHALESGQTNVLLTITPVYCCLQKVPNGKPF